MCSHCDGGNEYRESIEADARARRRAEAPLKIVCAWHVKNFGVELVMREGAEPVSHGICERCAAMERCEHLHARWDASRGTFICLNAECGKVLEIPELERAL